MLLCVAQSNLPSVKNASRNSLDDSTGQMTVDHPPTLALLQVAYQVSFAERCD